MLMQAAPSHAEQWLGISMLEEALDIEDKKNTNIYSGKHAIPYFSTFLTYYS